MASNNQLPDFLGVGAVKAGTTWLHRNLFKHSELYLPIQKPVFFWDRHREKGLESYARIFEPGRDCLCGEFTASYSVLPAQTKDEIRDLMPDLKLILILREPKSRAWSEAKMELTLIQERDTGTLQEGDYLDFLESEKCRERGDYAAIIREWSARFPREQIYIGLYDDIVRDPRKLLTEVFEFLDVAAPEDWAGYPFRERIFKGPEIGLPARCGELLDSMYTPSAIEEMSSLAGIDLAQAWNYA
ncbi:MAG TPA: hypothetical protein EYQ74_03640 [Planctomycetes bacterium]|nr:hypothetical protein [Planctomycetota bacterium]HIK59615.1 hypothetical protein [Planctomycetota bacterium]